MSCSAMPWITASSSPGTAAGEKFCASTPASTACDACGTSSASPGARCVAAIDSHTGTGAGSRAAAGLGRRITLLPALGAHRDGGGFRGAGAGRRLAHALQQLLEDDSVVALFVAGRVDQRDLLAAPRQVVEVLERRGGLGLVQFVEVALAEDVPRERVGVEPLAQRIGGREVAQPLVDRGLVLGDAARPQAVDQDTQAVGHGRLVVGALA